MHSVLLDRNTGYSNNFFNRLEALNAEKEPTAPVAVVLKGKTLEPWISQEPLILQMARTHRVALQSIDQGCLIRQKIREVRDSTGIKPKKLVLLSHGAPFYIELGPNTEPQSGTKEHLYSLSDVQEEDFSDLDDDAQILMSGCRTGSLFCFRPALAERIATVSRRTVFAPSQNLEEPYTCIFELPDQRWAMASYLQLRMQHVFEFSPNAEPISVTSKTLQDSLKTPVIQDAFSSYANYIEQYALEGSAQAQGRMAEYCLMELPGYHREDAIHWFLMAATAANDPKAQYRLGKLYLYGEKGIAQSDENALYWLQLAANQGNHSAQLELGLYFEREQEGSEQSACMAAHYFQLAANQGNPFAIYKMGFYLENGLGGFPQSDTEAVQYYRRAAELDDKSALYKMGEFYEWGKGDCAVSEAEAMHYYSQAAQKEHPIALCKMGVFWESGKGGLPASDENALPYYAQAAEKGFPHAQYRMGEFWESGKAGLQASDEKALAFYIQAAEKGHHIAKYRMGEFLESGKAGLTASETNALAYYLEASEQKMPEAQCQVGRYWEYGLAGLSPSDTIALKYYQAAADNGVCYAQCKMGEFYEFGRGGLSMSKQHALFYYGLAAQQNYAPAATRLFATKVEQMVVDPEIDRASIAAYCWKITTAIKGANNQDEVVRALCKAGDISSPSE